MRMVNISGPFASKAIAEGVAQRMCKGYKKVKVVRKSEPFANGEFGNFIAPIVSWYVHSELGR